MWSSSNERRRGLPMHPTSVEQATGRQPSAAGLTLARLDNSILSLDDHHPHHQPTHTTRTHVLHLREPRLSHPDPGGNGRFVPSLSRLVRLPLSRRSLQPV